MKPGDLVIHIRAKCTWALYFHLMLTELILPVSNESVLDWEKTGRRLGEDRSSWLVTLFRLRLVLNDLDLDLSDLRWPSSPGSGVKGHICDFGLYKWTFVYLFTDLKLDSDLFHMSESSSWMTRLDADLFPMTAVWFWTCSVFRTLNCF